MSEFLPWNAGCECCCFSRISCPCTCFSRCEQRMHLLGCVDRHCICSQSDYGTHLLSRCEQRTCRFAYPAVLVLSGDAFGLEFAKGGADLHAGPLFGGEQLITAEMAIALLKAFYAEDEECHRPGSALSRKAARNAGTVEAWGPVRYAERFQIFRAVSCPKPGEPLGNPLASRMLCSSRCAAPIREDLRAVHPRWVCIVSAQRPHGFEYRLLRLLECTEVL